MISEYIAKGPTASHSVLPLMFHLLPLASLSGAATMTVQLSRYRHVNGGCMRADRGVPQSMALKLSSRGQVQLY